MHFLSVHFVTRLNTPHFEISHKNNNNNKLSFEAKRKAKPIFTMEVTDINKSPPGEHASSINGDTSWVDIGENETYDDGDISWNLPSEISSVISLDDSLSQLLDQRAHGWSYKDAVLLPAPPRVATINNLYQNQVQRQEKKRRLKGAGIPKRVEESVSDGGDGFCEKPLTDKLRSKYETSGRRRNLKGHTGRRIDPYYERREDYKMELDGGDKNFLTAIEARIGQMVPYGRSLDNHRAWEEIPALLEAECVGEPEVLKVRAEYHTITTFQLRPQVVVREKCITKRHAKDRDRFIYFKPSSKESVPRPRRIFAEINTDPPKGIKGILLAWSTKAQTSRRIKSNIYGGYEWDVQEDGHPSGGWSRPFLEIDLGQSSTVTAISTQGGSPPIRRYPSVRRSKCEPGYIVEGRYRKEKYEGPFWTVLDPAHTRNPRHATLRWVRSYELWWRSDGGRGWNCLGTFQGNNDTTTENAHLLTGYQMGALSCRYLRFVPIDVENGGAMRISVYGGRNGEGVGGSNNAAPKKGLTDSDLDTKVEYRLKLPSPRKVFGAMQRDIYGYRNDRNIYNNDPPASQTRFLRSQQAKAEAHEQEDIV